MRMPEYSRTGHHHQLRAAGCEELPALPSQHSRDPEHARPQIARHSVFRMAMSRTCPVVDTRLPQCCGFRDRAGPRNTKTACRRSCLPGLALVDAKKLGGDGGGGGGGKLAFLHPPSGSTFSFSLPQCSWLPVHLLWATGHGLLLFRPLGRKLATLAGFWGEAADRGCGSVEGVEGVEGEAGSTCGRRPHVISAPRPVVTCHAQI